MSGELDNRPPLCVHLLPELANPHDFAGGDVVVIDVLRATTSITAALASGAKLIVPCLEVAEARNRARRRKERAASETVLLGGERQGQKLPGFDLGNSPADYTTPNLKGSEVVFTSTNGTRAMMRCVGAGRVRIACFSNLTAVASTLAGSESVDIICAGTDGEASWEDMLCAGALTSKLLGVGLRTMNDAARIALQLWLGSIHDGGSNLADQLVLGRGGQNLIRLGLKPDIDWASSVDRYQLVPELDLTDWTIRPSANADGAPEQHAAPTSDR